LHNRFSSGSLFRFDFNQIHGYFTGQALDILKITRSDPIRHFVANRKYKKLHEPMEFIHNPREPQLRSDHNLKALWS
ncbi:hypothetical protein QA786_15305, partial [Listeria monocytogenes]|nr:hypothetical protein [Listeria monocytogenes]